jgi:hypothetical protein
VRRLASGTYEVSRLYFVMNGDWQIKIQRKRGAIVVEEEVQAIRIGDLLDAAI